MSSIDIKINTDTSSLKETRDRIKEIKSALIDIEDPEEFAAMSLEAAELETKLRRVNSQISMMSGSGDALARLSGGFKQVGRSILSLDFTAALEQAKTLEMVSKGISFKSAISSVKNLGKTFVSLGKTLLTNPIFLLATAIALIVVGIIALMDKLGILEKVMEAIGSIIDFVIGLLKSLTDWLGLTAHAAEDSANRQIQANKDIIESQKLQTQSVINDLDREIAKRNELGENVSDLQKKRIDEIIEGNRIEREATAAVITNLMTLRETASKERQKEIDEEIKGETKKLNELINLNKNYYNEIDILEIRENKKSEKRQTDLNRNLKLQNIAKGEDEIEVVRKTSLLKLKNEVEDFKKSSDFAKLTYDERVKWVEFFKNKQDEINAKADADILKRNKAETDERKRKAEAEIKAELQKSRFLEDLRLKQIDDEIERETQIALVKEKRLFEDLDKSRLNKDELELVERVHQANLEKIINSGVEKKNRRDADIIEAERVLNNNLLQLDLSLRASRLELISDEEARKKAEDELELERLATETEIYLDNLRVRLEAGEITENEFRLRREIAEQEHSNKVNAVYQKRIDEQKKLDEEKALFEAKLREENMKAVYETSRQLLQTITETTGEGAAISKAAAVAATTIDTYQAAMAAYSAVAGVPIIGPALGVAAAGAAIAVGASAVKNILSTPVPGGGGGGGGSVRALNINTGRAASNGPTINMTGTRGDTTRQDEGGAIERGMNTNDKIRVEVLSSDIVRIGNENIDAVNRATIS